MRAVVLQSVFSLPLSIYRPAEKLNHILREYEWSDEAKLINSYHIPKKQVYIAKALNAHDSWDYEGEYKCLIKGGLKEQAKMALLHFLLPKIYDGKTCLIILQWIIFVLT